MKLLACLLFAMSLGACLPPPVATGAVVTRWLPADAGQRLITCNVSLGWSELELHSRCGEPDGTALYADGIGKCALYHSVAASFRDAGASPWIAVCMRARGNTALTKHTTVEYVDLVAGLAEPPPMMQRAK